jgi:hypothetical protein
MFQGINGVCRVMQNRFVGIVSFYGDAQEPVTPELVRLLAGRQNLVLTSNGSQLSFCDNELTQLGIATALARQLSTPIGTASVFSSAVVHGNTFVEQNNVFAAGLLAVDANAFIATPAGDSFYGAMLAMRATAAGNLALTTDSVAQLRFVVPNAATNLSKAANQVFVSP